MSDSIKKLYEINEYENATGKNYYDNIGVKPNHVDSNGIMYSKDALTKAVKEFIDCYKVKPEEGEFVIGWTLEFERQTRLKMLELVKELFP